MNKAEMETRLDERAGQIEQLKQELATSHRREKALREALQVLYDEQNGPPLLRHEKTWQAAMDRACELLGEPG